jgi:hypothetical protein
MRFSRPPLLLRALVLPVLCLSTAAGAAGPGAAPATTEPPAAAPTGAVHATPAVPAARSQLVELPTFRSGLWEYRRTLTQGNSQKPQVVTIKICADPGKEMRAKLDDLKQKGCQFAPLSRSNDRYMSSWICQTPSGVLRFRDTLIVKDENGYQDVSETHSAQSVTQQKIEATRLGECPNAGAAAPSHMPNKPRPGATG